jgi:hypothetical protein
MIYFLNIHDMRSFACLTRNVVSTDFQKSRHVSQGEQVRGVIGL